MRIPALLHSSILTRVCFAAIALAAVSSCTVHNPRDCSDGTCTDSRYPFCDVDGHFPGSEGYSLTCIAVSCTPGEFAECRADTAKTCFASGVFFVFFLCSCGCVFV